MIARFRVRTKNPHLNNVCELRVDFVIFCEQYEYVCTTSPDVDCRVRLSAHSQLLSKITFQGSIVNGNCEN